MWIETKEVKNSEINGFSTLKKEIDWLSDWLLYGTSAQKGY